jgi:hypothetical protein
MRWVQWRRQRLGYSPDEDDDLWTTFVRLHLEQDGEVAIWLHVGSVAMAS